MNEKLIEILSLEAKATETDIVNAVKALAKKAAAQTEKDAGEKEITDLITKSGGALNRTSAKMVLKDRKAESAKAKK